VDCSVFLTFWGLSLFILLRSWVSKSTQNKPPATTSFPTRYSVEETARRATSQCHDQQYLTLDDAVDKQEDQTSSLNTTQTTENQTIVEARVKKDKSPWEYLKSNGYVILCIIGIACIGIPLEIALHNSWPLDGFSLWLCWLVAIRLQRMVKSSHLFGSNIRCRHTLATMINPVLITTLLMLGFTRFRGWLSGSGGIAKILQDFSSGSPLYSILTAIVVPSEMSQDLRQWFGAGDAALSLLECGMVTWGFKLYECRKQLFSVSGISTLLFSAVAACANVFLSVLLARGIGLQPEEALAFSARSATLALAKPSVKALGGNIALNATLVVSNGILGQLVYPVLLEKISVPTVQSDSVGDEQKTPDQAHEDSAVTVAAGTAIGINGAAMGVSYLYEVRSRAAPYAALSMTMFGVMTVVFTTLEPFKTTTLKLAYW
jgi:putative effector of murein hydrolase